MRAYNFGGSGSKVTKLFHATCREIGVFKWAQYFGEGPPPKIWKGKKRLKFGAISDNYRLRKRISPERIDISKTGKVLDQQQPLPRWLKKRWWTLVHKQKVIGAHVDPPKLHFSTDYFGPWGCWPLKFLHALPHISSLKSFYRYRKCFFKKHLNLSLSRASANSFSLFSCPFTRGMVFSAT